MFFILAKFIIQHSLKCGKHESFHTILGCFQSCIKYQGILKNAGCQTATAKSRFGNSLVNNLTKSLKENQKLFYKIQKRKILDARSNNNRQAERTF